MARMEHSDTTMDVVANRKEVIMYPFYNFGYGFPRRNNVQRLDRAGIPVVRTIYVTTDTEANQVTYGLCPYQWRQLPNEGVLLLNVQHAPAAGTPAEAPILIDPTHTSSNANTSSNISAGGKQLINGSGEQMVNQEVTVGNKYFVYYNKCNGVFQVVNHIVTPTAAPAA